MAGDAAADPAGELARSTDALSADLERADSAPAGAAVASGEDGAVQDQHGLPGAGSVPGEVGLVNRSTGTRCDGVSDPGRAGKERRGATRHTEPGREVSD